MQAALRPASVDACSSVFAVAVRPMLSFRDGKLAAGLASPNAALGVGGADGLCGVAVVASCSG